jgi:hypothetical protein
MQRLLNQKNATIFLINNLPILCWEDGWNISLNLAGLAICAFSFWLEGRKRSSLMTWINIQLWSKLYIFRFLRTYLLEKKIVFV